MCDVLFRKFVLILFLFCTTFEIAQAQEAISRYEGFELKGGELYWTNTYNYTGSADSIRRAVVQMLKSKNFTQNVIRNEVGYNGEIRHFEVDCKRYNRKYVNTARMYWEGEWSGKFTVEIKENRYRITIFGLYYKIEDNQGYYKTTRTKLNGNYIDVVTRSDRMHFRKGEFEDLSLMNISLKDQFDIKYSRPVGGAEF